MRQSPAWQIIVAEFADRAQWPSADLTIAETRSAQKPRLRQENAATWSKLHAKQVVCGVQTIKMQEPLQPLRSHHDEKDTIQDRKPSAMRFQPCQNRSRGACFG